MAADRRRFLTAGAAVVGAAASAQLWLPATARAAEAPLPAGLFSLGVASGDPLPDGIVLWTRLAPDPLNGGGMPDRTVPVQWEISPDPRFAASVRKGTAQALSAYGHSVHVDVRGLRPGSVYWYRFRAAASSRPWAAPAPRPASSVPAARCASRSPPARTGSTATSRRTPTCSRRTRTSSSSSATTSTSRAPRPRPYGGTRKR